MARILWVTFLGDLHVLLSGLFLIFNYFSIYISSKHSLLYYKKNKNKKEKKMKGWLSFSSMETQKPYIAMVFVQCVYAGMALFSKTSIDRGMSPFVFVFYRQAFASLALAPFTYFFERTKAPPPPLSYCLLCKIFFIALFGITLSLNLYYFALNYTSATLAAATPNVIPAITFIMAVLLRMESISVKHYYGVAKITGTIICLSGALVIAFYKGPSALKFMNNQNQTHELSTDTSLNASSNKVDSWVKGALIMLSANTVWSLWLILQAPIIRRYPAKIHLTALQSCFSCIQSAIVAIVFERNPSSWKLGWNIHLLSVAYCGIIVSGITYWLQVWCIEKKGPFFTALFTPLALLITVIFSSFLWKETIYWGSVCGAFLLVGGLYGVLWGKNREEMGDDKDEIRSKRNKQTHDVNKDETILDCTTQPSPC